MLFTQENAKAAIAGNQHFAELVQVQSNLPEWWNSFNS